jgi:enterochelin esterase-like enzyme
MARDRCSHPRSLSQHLLKWLGWIGLLTLAVACLSSPRRLPQSIPTAVSPATATRVPTEMIAVSPTPSWTWTPEAQKPQETEVCRASQGQLSVAFVDSSVLSRRVAYSLYLPPCYGADRTRLYPVLYLLHGLHADHTQWPDLNVASNADALISQGTIAPLVVVMPDGDYRQGEDYAAFMLYDLIPYIEQTWRVAPERQDRAIGGLSQGGYWALELALAHPELFSAVGGHSPSTNLALTDLRTPDPVPGLNSLRVYLDVGNDDPLASGVTTFAAALRAHGLTPIFHVYPGGHNRPYWRSHTAEYLTFYAEGWKK